MYAKDISKKVKACFKSKQENGKFIGSYAPYGYLKDPNDKNKLIIDDNVSNVIQRIYALFLGGNSTRQ